MALQHLDRLSAVDAGFLHQEDRGHAHMHIGGVAILAGAPPSNEEFLRHIRRRIHLLPRYRQKLAFPPLQTGRPLWVDDPDFTLEYHVRQTALPSPGTEEQLQALVGRIFSQRLDRTKPLWELWLVEGLQGDRFALVTKTHHALIDGVSGIDIMTALVDLTPEPRVVESVPWTPAPTPSGVGLVSRGLTSLPRLLTGVARTATGAAQHPQQAVGGAVGAVQALAETATVLLRAAPPTPFNAPPGPHRRYRLVRIDLEDVKSAKNAFGGTVNDVLLSVVAGALGRFLRHRGLSTDELTLRACVPVSLRTAEQQGALGNRIAIMVAPLPVSIDDPVERLAAVRRGMDGLKSSKQALGAEVLTRMEEFAPPRVLAQASRLGFSSRLYNLLVTNVPGPQFAVYLLGRELTEAFPVAFLAPEHRLAVAIVSYHGRIGVGLLADYDAVPDLDVLGKEIEVATGELVTRARQPAATAARPSRSRAARRPRR